MRLWVGALAGLAAVRVAVPLAALAASGSSLPGLPRYIYEPTPADAHAYYSAARELIAAWSRVGELRLLAAAILLVAGALAAQRLWRRRPEARGSLVVAASLLVSLVVALAVSRMVATGAGAVGWPLVWAAPMLPYRAVGLPLDPGIAFGFGLAVSLLANVVTVVATAVAGRAVTGRAGVGLLAAGAFAFWPLASGLLAGPEGWRNGTWAVDAGLHMYTEPVSTALVAAAAALLLSAPQTPVRLALAGAAAGLATVVRPTNGLFALLLLAFAFHRSGVRAAVLVAGGALALAPVQAAFWPRRYGYELTLAPDPGVGPARPFALDYVVPNWTDSLLVSPLLVAVVVPLAVAGAIALRPRSTALFLVAWALANPLVYSFFAATWEHPRYLFASLPALLVLWASGVSVVASGGVRTVARAVARGERATIMRPS